MEDVRDGRSVHVKTSAFRMWDVVAFRVYPRSCIDPVKHGTPHIWANSRFKKTKQTNKFHPATLPSFFSASWWRKLNQSSSNRFVLMKLLFSVFWTMGIYVARSEFIVKYHHQFNIWICAKVNLVELIPPSIVTDRRFLFCAETVNKTWFLVEIQQSLKEDLKLGYLMLTWLPS